MNIQYKNMQGFLNIHNINKNNLKIDNEIAKGGFSII